MPAAPYHIDAMQTANTPKVAGLLLCLSALVFAGCPGGEEAVRGRKTDPLEERIHREMAAQIEVERLRTTDKPEVVVSPNPVSSEEELPVSNDFQGDKDCIDVSVVDKWRTGNWVHFTLLLRNVTDKGVRKRLYLIGYDKNGRITEAFDRALYFQPKEQILQRFDFDTNTGLTRWVVTVR